MTTMMRCGHAANAVQADGSPVCVICVGLDADRYIKCRRANGVYGIVQRLVSAVARVVVWAVFFVRAAVKHGV